MTLYSIADGSSAEIVADMISVLYPDVETILDTTYGSGKFWTDADRARVTGMDRDPARAKDVCADFTALPFADRSFDLVVFDPPYHTDTGKRKASVMADRFGSYATLTELEAAVRAGAAEAFRVARIGTLVKVQDYMHASQLVEMTQWTREAVGQPWYQRIDARRKGNKIRDPKWKGQLSAYSNGATYLAFRHGSQRHVRRGGQRERRSA